MLVTSYGFSVDAGNEHVSLIDLFGNMAGRNGEPDTSKSNERRFFLDVDSDDDFIRGLVVTVKDQRRFLKLIDEGGNFAFKVNNLLGDDKLMEFNFFVVNKANGLGLYQYYHQSCSIGTFGSYLKSRYRALCEASRDEQIRRLHGIGQHTRKKETRIRSEHRDGLSFAILTRSDSLTDVLTQLKEIRSFEYELVELAPQVAAGQPLGGLVRKMREKVVFVSGAAVDLVAAGILGMLPRIRQQSSRVYGIDDDDVPVSVRVANIPANFGEQEFDQLANELDNLDVGNFANDPVIERLIAVCRDEYPHVFLAEV